MRWRLSRREPKGDKRFVERIVDWIGMAATVVFVAGVSWFLVWAFHVRNEGFGPATEARVRVGRLITGVAFKRGAIYDFEVTFPDGSPHVVTLRHSFAAGTVLRLLYSRGPNGALRVYSYTPVPESEDEQRP